MGHKLRKIFSVISSLALTLVSLFAAQPASAVTNFTVTVVASGGAAENTSWSYASGEITPTASVSINASDIVAKLANGPLVVYSGRIVVSASISNPTANTLTLKAQGNIIVGGGLTLESQGGDIIFNADSDANQVGHVRMGFDANCNMGNILTSGGDIVVGGGSDPRTTSAWAQNTDAHATTCLASGPLAGFALYNYTLNAGGGDISIRGASPTLAGNPSARGININASGGQVPTLRTSGSGTIYLYGDGSAILNNTAWGIAASSTISVITDSGDITFEGRGNASGPTNARGVAIGQASTFTSTTGDISFIDRTNGALAGYTGIYIGAAMTATTAGNYLVQADEIVQTGALNLNVNNATIAANTTSSFTAVYSTGVINAANSNSLSIGAPGNTAAVTLAGAVTAGGPIAVNAASVTINAALTATNSAVTFNTTGGVTQNAAITASTLNLVGTASYNPQSLTVTGGVAQLAKLATFDTQGGSPVAVVAFAIGGRLNLPAGPTKAGYEFVGWFTSPSGGSPLPANYLPGSDSDITLYAQWGLPGSNSMVGSWMHVSATKGETVRLTFTGKYLDTVSKVSASSGVAKIVSQSADKIEIEVSGADLGKGSIQLVGNSQTLTLGDIFTVTAAKQAQSIASLKLPKAIKVGKTFSFSRKADSGLSLTAKVSGGCKLATTSSTYRLTATSSGSVCRLTLSNQGSQTWLPFSSISVVRTSR